MKYKNFKCIFLNFKNITTNIFVIRTDFKYSYNSYSWFHNLGRLLLLDKESSETQDCQKEIVVRLRLGQVQELG